MKIKYLVPFLVFSLTNTIILAQKDDICIVIPMNVEENEYTEGLKTQAFSSYNSYGSVTINVVFHIINNAVTSSQTLEMVNLLNSTFNQHNIYFTKLCDHNSPNESSSNDLPYAINIYINPLRSTASARWPGTAIYMPVSKINTSTLPHEVGHNLYLAHTHGEGCLEYVDGSNCETCGDYVCDTPADPNLIRVGSWVDMNCNWVGDVTDPNGDPYNPDVRNFMSYSRASCRNRFTQGQVERMHTALRTFSFLIAVTRPPEIQGPSTVCSNATYSFKGLTPSLVNYSSSNPSGLSIDSSTGVATRQNNFVGPVVITATTPLPCGTNASLTKSVWVGTPNQPLSLSTSVSDLCVSSIKTISINPVPGATSYSWVSNNSELYLQGTLTTNSMISAEAPGDFSFTITAINACNTNNRTYAVSATYCNGDDCGVYPFPPCEPMLLATYPNPTQDQLHITLDESYAKTTALKWEVELVDSFGRKWIKRNSSKRFLDVNMKELPKGLYYLRIHFPKGSVVRQIIKE